MACKRIVVSNTARLTLHVPHEDEVADTASALYSHLDVPVAVTQVVQTELLGDFSGTHGVRKILLVGKDEQDGVPKLIFRQHAVKLFACLSDTLAIVAVHHKDQA